MNNGYKGKDRHFWSRVISILLLIVMLSEEFIGSGNIVMAAGTGETVVTEQSEAEVSETVENADDTEVLFEMEEKREQRAKHYRLSDGSIMAADYGMDIHYQKNGQWEDIDNRFVYEAATETDNMNGFSTAEGAVEFKFAPDTSNGEVVRTSDGAYSVSFEFLGEAVRSERSDSINSDTAESISEDIEMEDAVSVGNENTLETGISGERTTVPITFVKGDLLNADVAMEALSGTAAEDSVQIFTEDPSQEIMAVSGLLASADDVTEDSDNVQNSNRESSQSKVDWVEVGTEQTGIADDTLMQQTVLENIVTSVGYANVLAGVSLQYVARGNSLKEYILIDQQQENYDYIFRMNLTHLVPAMQYDGGIYLNDTETGETVYTIPAAYMTDASDAYSDAVEMEIQKEQEGVYLFKISADKDWINAEERVFPVQIDPTLNRELEVYDDIMGFYLCQDDPNEKTTNNGSMYVGYDSSGNGNMRTYIQIKNLPALPSDSVICAAVFNMGVRSYSQSDCPKLYVQAKEVTGMDWTSNHTWGNIPTGSVVLDQCTIGAATKGEYVSWDITPLVKQHYEAGNDSEDILGFTLMPHLEMGENPSPPYANTSLYLVPDGARPIFQILYRDTRGVEGYYTYQTQNIGNAGVGYVGDYNLQLTVAKTLASYSSASQPFDLEIVYNSSYSGKHFTNDGDIHTKDYSKMIVGKGWKLNVQETVTTIDIENLDDVETYLVYNDADGTEHYFRKKEGETDIYEDEDGLNLTIEKAGSNFTMTDKKDNKKYFEDGYLKYIEDGNGNKTNIYYNSDVQIDYIKSHPNGGTEKKIFYLEYDENNCLSSVTSYDLNGNPAKKIVLSHTGTGKYHLNKVGRLSYDAESKTWSDEYTEANYIYNVLNQRLTKAFDYEKKTGIEYEYGAGPTGYFVYEYHTFAANIAMGVQTVNARVRAWPTQTRQTRYRSAGADAELETSDDVVTTYVFNSSGQTINAISTDPDNNTLGVTAAAYEENSETNSTNNHISNSIASGQAGVNLFTNGGFEGEIDTSNTALGWTNQKSGGNVACRGSSEANGTSHSGKNHYNLYNSSTTGSTSIYQDVSVLKGETYTFSAYVNTLGGMEFGTDGGVYLYVLLVGLETVAESYKLSHISDENISNGWQRISTTFTMEYSGTMRFIVCWKNAKGTVMVDDVQLEKGSAATRFNHVYNGSFESGTSGWSISSNVTISTEDVDENGVVDKSLLMTASTPEATLYAQQEIKLNRSSNTTFLLSAWSKGNSMPGLVTEIEENMDSTVRFWGIEVTLKYSDTSLPDDVFYLPFSDYATNWQYAAMAVTPDEADKTVASAVLKVYYHNNANKVYFDDISFIEEPAQTYTYDTEGNVKSVETSGNGEDGYEYDLEMEDLIRVSTAGSGDYEYGYMDPDKGNEHLVTSVTNDTITMGIDYNAQGLAKESKLENNDEEAAYNWIMTSSASYSSDGRLLSVTDNTGAVTSYGYDVRGRVNMVKDADDTAEDAVYSTYDDVWDRETGTYQNNVTSVGAVYNKGNLTTLNRNGYIPGNSAKQTQKYNFAYNKFGSNTSISIGSQKIADYSYSDVSGNAVGNLEKISYGGTTSPLTEVEYTYDKLDRVTEVEYTDNNTNAVTSYGYRYSSDGNLANILKNDEFVYSYDYDTLGRLIHSTTVEDGQIVLYTDHQYDTSNRIKYQSWQIGEDGFSESYTYNPADGTLTTMVTDGDTLSFSYDGLKRLAGRESTNLKMNYTYRNLDSTNTTSQIASIVYKKANGITTLLPTLGYTYDAVGNITKVTSGTSNLSEYTYDTQNQLVSEYRYGDYLDSYSYDTYGNIRSISRRNQGAGVGTSYSFAYGNTNWKDQLTGVSYTDEAGDIVSRTLTYDAIGNPLTYYNGNKNWTFTWMNGKQLASASDGTNTITNIYDVDGKRSSKTVNGVEHKYVVLGEKIVRETFGTVTVDYFYDNDGRPYKILVNDGTDEYVGYYVLNLQGDVIGIVNSSGAVTVKYTYDAWGNQVGRTYSSTNATSNALYQYNSLKYRGYYYDKDLELYYLNSRYYDPIICRFINADDVSVMAIEQGSLLQYNLYTYCLNNPVKYADSSGNVVEMLTAMGAAMIGGGIAGAFISGISYAITSCSSGEFDPVMLVSNMVMGAAYGALGAGIGMMKIMPEIKFAASIGVGLLAGVWTGLSTNDWQAGFVAGASTALCCFTGSLIDIGELGKLATGYASYNLTLSIGTPFEVVSVMGQNVSVDTYLKCPASSYTTTQTRKSAPYASPGAAGMTTTEYFAYLQRNGYRIN